jgi:hypothetical protein
LGLKTERKTSNIANRARILFSMRHFMVFVAGLAFAFAVLACNADKSSDIPTKTQPTKAAPKTQPTKAAPMKSVKKTRVSFTGIVKELSDTTIMVERNIKSHVETMEFALDKPIKNVKVGDKVKVSYIKKEDKNIAPTIVPAVDRKIIKKVAPANEPKPTSIEAQPPKK